MTNVFCITYGGHASNGNMYVPYKAIAHTAEEAIAVINTWKPYGGKNRTDNIVVNERTAEKIRALFRDGLGGKIYENMRTTGCGAWDISFYPALADTIEEHERIYNERREAAKADRMRQAEEAKKRRIAELNEQRKGWYHAELVVKVMVFNSNGNDYFTDITFSGNVIADSGMDAYHKAVKHVHDNPQELEHRGNIACLLDCPEPDSSGFDFTFLGVRTDEGFSVEKWQEWHEKREI